MDNQATEDLATDETFLCHNCIRELYLSDQIQREGRKRQCSFCNEAGNGITIEALADRVEQVFAEHFRRTSDMPDPWQQSLLSDRESCYNWVRDGYAVTDASMGAADIPEEAAKEIQGILEDRYSDYDAGEETEFHSDSYYDEKSASDEAWQEEWRGFERSLKREARFFSRESVELLKTCLRACTGCLQMTAGR